MVAEMNAKASRDKYVQYSDDFQYRLKQVILSAVW